jgi:hypothetical protein
MFSLSFHSFLFSLLKLPAQPSTVHCDLEGRKIGVEMEAINVASVLIEQSDENAEDKTADGFEVADSSSALDRYFLLQVDAFHSPILSLEWVEVKVAPLEAYVLMVFWKSFGKQLAGEHD